MDKLKTVGEVLLILIGVHLIPVAFVLYFTIFALFPVLTLIITFIACAYYNT